MKRQLSLVAVAALVAVALAWLVARPAKSRSRENPIPLRISHFRPSIPATVQKARGSLERKLAPLGVAVQWNEFKATTDSILALSSGAIDLSVGGVEGGVAAIASGVPLRLVATGPHRAPKTGWYTALLVRESSAIRTLADLKGKKIGVGRGGFSEAVLAVAVRRGGWSYPKDIEPVYLSTADATNAFTSGLVDAVLTLDPYVPSIQREVPTRILTDNQQLGYPTIWAVWVNEKFASEHPDILAAATREFLAVGPWIEAHRAEAATSLAAVVGFEQSLWETTLGRASYVLEPPGPDTLRDIQYVADQLLELGVIKQPVDVQAHTWKRDASRQ
jgi:sulfonate transport system substrate-binding protein